MSEFQDSNGIKWYAKSTYVDIDTGEILKKSNVLLTDKFIILQTIKNTTFNATKTTGYIEYTIKCRKNPQGKLFAD